MDDVNKTKPLPSATRRRNTTKACDECRRRRAKCDGRKPVCGRCLARHLTCKYAAEEDGRQPAPKSYVLLLRKRVDLLERSLRMHGIDVEASVARLAAADCQHSVPAHGAHFVPLQPEPQHFSNADEDWETEDLSSAFAGALSLDDSVNFDEDGEHHYFGPTSGRIEFLELDNDRPSPQSQQSQSDESTSVTRKHRVPYDWFIGRVINGQLISVETRAHLEELYFTWQHPWYQIVDRNLFRQSEQSNGRYFSPLLLNCILAVGSRFSDRPDVRTTLDDPKTAGKIFLDKIEVLLHYELKCPTITTIQSLTILSQFHVSIGSDTMCWLYQGMANRLALDSGFNVDPSHATSLPVEEIELRRRIYWALYCDDKLAASYTGRVCTMLTPQGAVKLPSALPDHLNRHGLETATDSSDDETLQIQLGLIKLCRILEKIFLTLYAPIPLLRGIEATTFLQTCTLELKNWMYDIHSSLRIDRKDRSKRLPQVYTLHMVYHTTYILLAKYFLSGKTVSEVSPRPSERLKNLFDDQTTSKARLTCHEAARELCAVAIKYRQAYGSFRCSPITATHCTLSAALVLIGTQQNRDAPSVTDSLYIDLCLEVLEELSKAWWPANRIRTRLEILSRRDANQENEDDHNDASSRDRGASNQAHRGNKSHRDENVELSSHTDFATFANSDHVGFPLSMEPSTLQLDDYLDSEFLTAWDWDMPDFTI